jgi:hypothetical protein
MSLTKASYSMINGAYANVLDYGASPSASAATNTSAFVAAIATGKRVYIPNGTYSVNAITLQSNTWIEGESTAGVILVANTNSSSIFEVASAGKISLSNMTWKAGTGVTNTKGFNQTSLADYVSWAEFTNIYSWANLTIAYSGFFIFTRWDNCHDGEAGSIPGGQYHQAIKSVPAATGQATTTNVNQVIKCNFNNANDPNGAIYIEWGNLWTFRDCDFEVLTTQAVYAKGIYGIEFDSCWFEDVDAVSVIKTANSGSPGVQGTAPVAVQNSFFNGSGGNTYFLEFGGASIGSVTNFNATNIPSGCTLANTTQLQELYGIYARSGVGAAGFTTGITAARSNLTVSSSEFTTSIINSPQTQNTNVLPFGPTGLGASKFTNVSFTSITNVASAIGLSGNAVQFTLANGVNQAAYYTMPAKMLTFLKGKTITLMAVGYASAGTATDVFQAAVWDSVSPSAANVTQSATAPNIIGVPGSGDLEITYLTYTVGAAATSFSVGFYNQGSAAGGTTATIESMQLVLGTIKPSFVGF